jgi:hypothetical protein
VALLLNYLSVNVSRRTSQQKTAAPAIAGAPSGPCQPQDHVAVAIAGATESIEFVHELAIDPEGDQAVGIQRRRRLWVEQPRLYDLVRGWGDQDRDHGI